MRGSLAKFLACPLPPPQPFDQTSDQRNDELAGAAGVSNRAHPHSRERSNAMPCLPRTCYPLVAEAPGLVGLGAQRLRSLSIGRSDTWGTGSQPPKSQRGCLGKPPSCVRDPTGPDPTKGLSDATPKMLMDPERHTHQPCCRELHAFRVEHPPITHAPATSCVMSTCRQVRS